MEIINIENERFEDIDIYNVSTLSIIDEENI